MKYAIVYEVYGINFTVEVISDFSIIIIIIIIISLSKGRGNTKGTRPVQGASPTHTIYYIQEQYNKNKGYNKNTQD